MENRTIIDSSNAITRGAIECKALVEAMYRAEQTADKLIAKIEPSLLGEC